VVGFIISINNPMLVLVILEHYCSECKGRNSNCEGRTTSVHLVFQPQPPHMNALKRGCATFFTYSYLSRDSPTRIFSPKQEGISEPIETAVD
jgi:hypothetical protein